MNTETFLSTYRSQINGTDRFLFFAPEPVNLMGEDTDYTGGLVLSAALSVGTYLFVKLIPEQQVRLTSLKSGETVAVSLDSGFVPQKKWTDFPVAVLFEMVRKGWTKQGLELIYFSDIPFRDAFCNPEVAATVTAFAVWQIFSLELSKKELVLLVQRAGQQVSDVQGRVAGQYTAIFGRPKKALFLDCYEMEHKETKACFAGYDYVMVKAKGKQPLISSLYRQRREELARVKKVIHSFFDVPYLGILRGEDHEWLDKLVEDETLKKRLRHLVNENTRVEMAAEWLQKQNVRAFGELMYASHNSLAFDFEVSDKTLDFLVRAASQIEGVVGVKMTTICRGCVLNLVKKEATSDFSQQIKAAYEKETGETVAVYPLKLWGEIKMFS